MDTSLRAAIDSGDYVVDPDAVADAILRRARARPLARRLAAEVLLSAPLLETSLRARQLCRQVTTVID